MVFFAVALAPGGNVAAALRALARKIGSGDPSLEAGLPVGLYLGFFQGATEENLAKSFKSGAPALFGSIPPLIHLETLVKAEAGWSLVAREDLCQAAEAAVALAGSLGLEPLLNPPLKPGSGYFVGKHVTTTEAEAFSFRHLDALLIRLETSSGRSEALVWTIVSRVRRLVGPRERRHRA